MVTCNGPFGTSLTLDKEYHFLPDILGSLFNSQGLAQGDDALPGSPVVSVTRRLCFLQLYSIPFSVETIT